MSAAGGQAPRDTAQRKADSLALLASPAVDVWVATAAPGSAPYLVPLSLAWVGERAVVAVEGDSRTARGLRAAGVARLGAGPTRDVTMLDVVLEREVAVGADQSLGDAYAAQADWDPRQVTGSAHGYVFMVLRPERIQAWREADELPGRTLMRAGQWLEQPTRGWSE